MAYSAYGELLTGKVSGYGYNGEYYDAATGMLNLRARQYEPAQGRFSQRDGLKGWATSPRSLNAYLYCQNDAINYFDASGATMVAVNMTDGGGGRKSNSSSSNLLQKAGQTIKSVVSAAASAAAVAKAANDQALVNSILKESRDPVAQLQRVRENRAQAQATTPTVVGHSFLRSVKKFACMTQEEYDAGSEVYGPQISNSTPQLIEAQNEDNIQSAKDNLVIAGGFGITLELIFAVSFCIEFTKDPITSRYNVQLLGGYGFGTFGVSKYFYGSYSDVPDLETYYNSTTVAMGGTLVKVGTDRLFLTNNETGELYSGRSISYSLGPPSLEAHVIQYKSIPFELFPNSGGPVYDYKFDNLLSTE